VSEEISFGKRERLFEERVLTPKKKILMILKITHINCLSVEMNKIIIL